MAANTITLAGTLNYPGGPFTLNGAGLYVPTPLESSLNLNLTTTYQSFALPATASAIIWQPPAGNSTAWFVAGANTDAGVLLYGAAEFYWPISPSLQGTLWIKSQAGTINGLGIKFA